MGAINTDRYIDKYDRTVVVDYEAMTLRVRQGDARGYAAAVIDSAGTILFGGLGDSVEAAIEATRLDVVNTGHTFRWGQADVDKPVRVTISLGTARRIADWCWEQIQEIASEEGAFEASAEELEALRALGRAVSAPVSGAHPLAKLHEAE